MKRSMSGRSSMGSVDSRGASRSVVGSSPVGRVTCFTCTQQQVWGHGGRAGRRGLRVCLLSQQGSLCDLLPDKTKAAKQFSLQVPTPPSASFPQRPQSPLADSNFHSLPQGGPTLSQFSSISMPPCSEKEMSYPLRLLCLGEQGWGGWVYTARVQH